MAAMSESFVDLSYRGLALGKRIKLTQVRGQAGYLEMPTPMPVGTTIAMTTDDGVQLDAVVTQIHEQVGGSDRVPGMVIKPSLDGDAATAWWRARSEPPPVPASVTIEPAAPEPIAEGEAANTAVMEAVVPEVIDAEIVEPRDSGSRLPVAVDDERSTQAMDAVDLAALGLVGQPPSDQFPAVKPEDYADDETPPAPGAPPEKPDAGGGKGKRKRKRR